MSFCNWTKAALQQSKARGAARTVLAAIACHSNKNGSAFPSIATIADLAGVSRRGAQKAINRLEQLGEITIQRGKGRGNASIYSLKIKGEHSNTKGEPPFALSETIKGEHSDIKGEHSDNKRRTPVRPKRQEETIEEPLLEVEELQKQFTPETILAHWNQIEGTTKARAITPDRERSAKARIREPFFRDHWKEAIEKVNNSNFCKGHGPRGWKADLDWFLRPGTVAKILEGKYDNRSGPGKPSQPDFDNMTEEQLTDFCSR